MADKPAAPTPAPSAPPWGDDFDAEKAWALIETLRASEKTLKTERAAFKTERDALATKVDEFENAGKTAEELKAASDRKAADELTAARRELWTERALRKHGVPEELMEFLTGDDEDAILAKAEKLAGLGKSKADPDPAPTDETPEPPAKSGRPAPGLTPGHGGNDPAPFDPDALVADIR